MAKKKNGNGRALDPIADILTKILEELQGHGRRLERLENGVGGLQSEMRGVNGRLDRMNTRLDNVIEITGRAHRDLERRVSHLEDKVANLDD